MRTWARVQPIEKPLHNDDEARGWWDEYVALCKKINDIQAQLHPLLSEQDRMLDSIGARGIGGDDKGTYIECHNGFFYPYDGKPRQEVEEEA